MSPGPQPTPPSGPPSDPASTAPGPSERTLTVGILLGVTLVGFETLAVITIAPEIAASFRAVERYGWIFSAFLLATLLGSVIAGDALDRRPPRTTLIAALLLFAAGLLGAGLAPSMTWLLLARALQGLGGGALVTAMYVAVTRAYPDHARPRVMAWMSSAWVLPALLGPTLAGAIATTVGWRWVFLGLLPIVAVVVWLTLPAFATLEKGQPSGAFGKRLRAAGLLVVGGVTALGGLDTGTVWGWGAAVAGAGVAVAGLRPLLPAGTLRLTVGLPAAVGARGSIYPAFVTAETMLSLMMVGLLGYSSLVAGMILAVGSLSWTAGAWLQERLDARAGRAGRGGRIAFGAGLLAAGLALASLGLVLTEQALWFAAVGWLLAGIGIGFGHATSSVHVFALAGPAHAGSASASLQVIDQFGAAIGAGLAGALVAASLSTPWGAAGGIAVALGGSVLLAVGGVLAGIRSGRAESAHGAVSDANV